MTGQRMDSVCVVGRLAPSPTGAQHIGNARTYLLAWLSARSQGGRLVLRIEDLDSPRVKPGADRLAIEDLVWLGLDWDEGPDRPAQHAPYYQQQRIAWYQDALDRLRKAEQVYPCDCTRSEIAAAASAPHESTDGLVYPGTCRSRTTSDASPSLEPYAWRFRVSDELLQIGDRIHGQVIYQPARQLGDFVVARHDWMPAYQLAVVVDDHLMGITEVVRGDDLLPSAVRQTLLYRFFGWEPPNWVHVPLVVGPDGRRLAKRHGDTRLVTLRQSGVPAERLIGLLAWSCGWLEHPEPMRAEELLPLFRWDSLPKDAWVFREEHWRWLIDPAAHNL
ncbi:MAG: glutamyl-Q tRNA(Asp) synthetase [Pirellulaceae bacterium]|nr:MAG: glutamyl-Q tRNA(Asp) synthetase [Pirellulaceae bacterium]GIW93787.1 MAG: glutamyl-Q tRNA(Asp) synthetase [Pirellulaceae bacterium]